MSGSVRQRGMGAVGSGPVSGVRRALEKLDAFPKFTKDFREQTTAGAVGETWPWRMCGWRAPQRAAALAAWGSLPVRG